MSRFMIVVVMLGFSKAALALSGFQAGAALANFNLPPRISLGGYIQRFTFPWSESPYAHYFKASTGVHDAPKAKALVLRADDKKIVFVSADLVAVTPQMFEELSTRLGDIRINPSQLFLAATHTHSGPGDFAESWLWETLAIDTYHEEVFYGLIDDMERAVRQADKNLEPAIVMSNTSQIPGVTFNRRKSPELDPALTLLRIDRLDGSSLATLINFPIHGTVLGPENLELSSDVPGMIEEAVSKSVGGVSLFFNGAEGDVGPLAKASSFEGAGELAERIAQSIVQTRDTAITILQPQAQILTSDINLGSSQFNIKACLNYSKTYFDKTFPHLTSQGLQTEARISVLSLDKMLFISIPGEITTAIGQDIKNYAAQRGHGVASILGLTNGYIGYILPSKDYLRGGYEACASFYGPQLSGKIVKTAKTLVEEIQ